MTLLDDIKKIIKEEKNRNGILLEQTRVIQTPEEDEDDDLFGNDVRSSPMSDTADNDEVFTNDPAAAPHKSQPPQKAIKDIAPGFNLYHGAMTQAFTEVQSMSEDGAGEITRKVTQWALMKLGGRNGEVSDMFEASGPSISPQDMAAIIQKAMLIILNHVSKEASKQASDKQAFNVADA